jgi:hypothetical protein
MSQFPPVESLDDGMFIADGNNDVTGKDPPPNKIN